MTASLLAQSRGVIGVRYLPVDPRGRSVEATIQQLLTMADRRGCCNAVACGLVGAELVRRFKREIPDASVLNGEFIINDAIIKVVMEPLNQRHYDEVQEKVAESKRAVWLLTRNDRAIGWRDAVRGGIDARGDQVIVMSMESFVCQGVTVHADFSTAGKVAQLKELFDLYSNRWVAKLGTPGIRIVMK